MLRHFALAFLLTVAAVDASASPKVVKTAPGRVTGVLSYASGQFWIKAGTETVCVMVDADDEPALEPLSGQEVEFSGPIQVWSDRSRCIVVGPAFPKATAASARGAKRPVMIGAHGQPDIDACPSVGSATSPVAVRLAPTATADVAVRLQTDQTMYLCGTSPDGAWESVVIPPSAGADCGVSGAVEAPEPYRGSCRSGWVEARYVDVVAG